MGVVPAAPAEWRLRCTMPRRCAARCRCACKLVRQAQRRCSRRRLPSVTRQRRHLLAPPPAYPPQFSSRLAMMREAGVPLDALEALGIGEQHGKMSYGGVLRALPEEAGVRLEFWRSAQGGQGDAGRATGRGERQGAGDQGAECRRSQQVPAWEGRQQGAAGRLAGIAWPLPSPTPRRPATAPRCRPPPLPSRQGCTTWRASSASCGTSPWRCRCGMKTHRRPSTPRWPALRESSGRG